MSAVIGARYQGATTTAAIRHRNSAGILHALWESGPMARGDLAERIGVTRAAVTRIIQDLVSSGHLEVGPSEQVSRSPGRPVESVDLAQGRHLCLGADLRLDRGRLRGVDLRGTELVDEEVEIVIDDVKSFVHDLSAMAQSVAREQNMPISALGVSMPILIRGPEDRVTWPRHGWANEPLRERLAHALKLPLARVQVGNVSGSAALANWREVTSRHPQSLAHLQMGIGGGLGLVDRSRYPAVSTREIGHLSVSPTGPHCRCGNRGCLDTLAGLEAFLAIARPADPGLGATVNMHEISAEVAHLAQQGNPQSLAAIDHAARWLAQAVASVSLLLEPAYLTLGGYPAALGDSFREPFLEYLAAFCTHEIQLVSTSLGDDASTHGAALLALRAVLDSPQAGPR